MQANDALTVCSKQKEMNTGYLQSSSRNLSGCASHLFDPLLHEREFTATNRWTSVAVVVVRHKHRRHDDRE